MEAVPVQVYICYVPIQAAGGRQRQQARWYGRTAGRKSRQQAVAQEHGSTAVAVQQTHPAPPSRQNF